jgi:hypothetical protein
MTKQPEDRWRKKQLAAVAREKRILAMWDEGSNFAKIAGKEKISEAYVRSITEYALHGRCLNRARSYGLEEDAGQMWYFEFHNRSLTNTAIDVHFEIEREYGYAKEATRQGKA